MGAMKIWESQEFGILRSVNKTVKVTGKGQIYFVNKLIPKKGA